MNAVVCLLDDETSERIDTLLDELREKFAVEGALVSPAPHFSLHVAGEYDLDLLADLLVMIAPTFPPFRIRTAGLGVFTSDTPVVHIPIVRDAMLSAFHERVWQGVAGCTATPDDNYAPERWVPHITLAMDDVDDAKLPDIVAHLAHAGLSFEIDINTLAIIADGPEGMEIHKSVTLTGADEAPPLPDAEAILGKAARAPWPFGGR